MTPSTPAGGAMDRRAFVQTLSVWGAAALASGVLPRLGHGSTLQAALRDRIGLQLFTVRDRFPNDYPGTLLKVAEIGYREVQTTLTYGDHGPAQIRSYLEQARLSAPTTHVSPVVGPDFERTLEGYQAMGHRYTTVRFSPPGGRARGAGGPGAGAGAQGRGAAGVGGAAAPGQRPGGGPRPTPPPQTLDSVKRTAEQLNQAGLVTRKYGMKVILHNHTEEFEPLADSSQRPYDVILAETDAELVAMELDIGWAAVAGQDAVAMFRAHPGRYEVWHVKDIAGMAELDGLPIPERRRSARIVPLGEGDIDYRPIFAAAELAGMKHFYVEQDTAPQSGDSLAAAAKSYGALMRLLA